MWKEFKEFISKGNVIDLAVGVIIGGAFGGIVTSLVNDIVMPALGLVIGGVNFKGLKFTFRDAKLEYGNFLQAVFNFLIIAAALFLLIKGINSFRRKKEEAPATPATPPEDVELLREIRDLLKAKR